MQTRLSSPVVAVGVVVGLIIGGADLVAGRPLWQAALGFAIPAVYGIVVALVSARSETVSVLAGRPVDERWQHINLVASTWAFGASAIVLLIAFVVANATSGDRLPYAFMGAVMAAAYVGSLAIIRARG
jgi:hypothetical protein